MKSKAPELLCIDKTYMMKCYKTEPCPRWSAAETNRCCRLGALCPYYHTSRDRRRKLVEIKYRYLCALITSMSMSTVDLYSASPHPPLMRYSRVVTVKKY